MSRTEYTPKTTAADLPDNLDGNVAGLLQCWDKGRDVYLLGGEKVTLELESVEACTAFFSRNDDRMDEEGGGWHQTYYGFEYEATKGKVVAVVRDCDTDGNWECVEEMDMGSEEYRRAEREYGYDEARKTHKEYARWVVEHGRDPIGEYFVSSEKTVKEAYEFRAEFKGEEVVIRGVRRQGRAKWQSPAKFPGNVNEYLYIPAGAGLGTIVRDCTPDQLRTAQTTLKEDGKGCVVWSETLDRKVPNARDVSELRAAARRSLKKD